MCGSLALILVLTWAVYRPVLTAPYVYETTRWSPDFFRPWQGWREETAFAWRYPTRTVTHLSFVATHAVSTQPWADHAGNLLVHDMNITLLYAMVSPVLGAWSGVPAALFALHPVQTEAVAYVSSRADLLAVTGILLACCAVTSRQTGLLVVGVVLAGLSKETGLMALPLALLWSHQTGPASPARLPIIAASLSLAVVSAGLVRQFGWIVAGPDDASAHLAMFTRLLGLVVWPVGLSIDHAWAWITPPVAVWFVLGWLLALWWTWLHPQRWLGFGLVWALVAILPRLFAQEAEPLHEHHLAAAMVGVSLALPLAIREWWAPALGSLLYGLRATTCALVGHVWVLPQRHLCLRCRVDEAVSDPQWIARQAAILRLRFGLRPPSLHKE